MILDLKNMNANRIIDFIIIENYDIRGFHDAVPKGKCVTNERDTKLYHQKEKAKKVIGFIEEAYSVPAGTFYKAAMIAERWYNKTEWKRMLPETDAERLLQCMIEQNTCDRYTLEGGDDYLLFMSGVIQEWAEKSLAKKESV